MLSISRLIGTGVVTMALLLGGVTRADNPPVSIDGEGRALRGYDTVAYFTDGKPRPGSTEFTHEWQGAVWLFASAAHRDAFAVDPERYAPQYGGYCAFALTNGSAIEARPKVWSIVDDKLYLNLGPGAQKRWRKDVPGNILRADNNWPSALVDRGRSQSTPVDGGDR